MLTNLSQFDRGVRFATGSLIWLLNATDSIPGGIAHLLAVIGVICLATSMMKFCPCYLICNFSTDKNTTRR